MPVHQRFTGRKPTIYLRIFTNQIPVFALDSEVLTNPMLQSPIGVHGLD